MQNSATLLGSQPSIHCSHFGPVNFTASLSFSSFSTSIQVLSEASSRSVAFLPRVLFIRCCTCPVTIQPEIAAAIMATNKTNESKRSKASNICSSSSGVGNSLSCPGRRSVRRVLADYLIGSYELWLNIRRQGLQSVQRFLYFRTQYHHLGHQFFGASVIACGFQREQDTIQSSHGVFDLAQVHAEGAVGVGDE